MGKTYFPFLSLPVDTYTAEESSMSLGECGAYTRLLVAMWRSNQALPNDDVKLARYARCSLREWRRVKPAVMAKLLVTDQDVSSQLIEEAHAQAVKRSQKAEHSARAKWLKRKTPTYADAMLTKTINKNLPSEDRMGRRDSAESFVIALPEQHAIDDEELRQSGARLGARMTGSSRRHDA